MYAIRRSLSCAGAILKNRPVCYGTSRLKNQVCAVTRFTLLITPTPTLEARRRSSDLVFMYKVVHNLVAVPITYHPPRSPRYMECVRFITYHCRVNVYQHSFFPQTVILWNQLPESTIKVSNGEFGQLQVSCSTTNNYVNWQDVVKSKYTLVFNLHRVHLIWTV